MKKLWYYNTKWVGFEGGETPTRSNSVWFIIPTIAFLPYAAGFLYGKSIAIFILKWHIAIKWQYQPDEDYD